MNKRSSQESIYLLLQLLLGCCGWLASMSAPIMAEQVVIVVLDDSGSMNDAMATQTGQLPKITAAKSALIKVINALPDDTKLGVTLLNGEATDTRLIALSKLDRSGSIRRIQQLSAGGGTPLGQAMREAADELLAYRKQHVYGTYRLLVITDGEANDPEMLDAYLPMILSRGITVDVIGVNMPSDHQLAAQAHSYRNVVDAESFEQAVSEILAESDFDQSSTDDFELIAALPDELAASALKTLSQVENAPIATSENDSLAAELGLANSPKTNGRVETIIGGGLCCGAVPCFLLVVLITIVFQLLNRSQRSHRRRRD